MPLAWNWQTCKWPCSKVAGQRACSAQQSSFHSWLTLVGNKYISMSNTNLKTARKWWWFLNWICVRGLIWNFWGRVDARRPFSVENISCKPSCVVGRHSSLGRHFMFPDFLVLLSLIPYRHCAALSLYYAIYMMLNVCIAAFFMTSVLYLYLV